MNRKLICDALDMIDDIYIEESILGRSCEITPSSERKSIMNRYKRSTQTAKRIIAVAAAVILMLALAISAAAANLWGIRDLLLNSGRDVSEQIDEYVEPQNSVSESCEWSCAVTETLCDNGVITIAVTVTCDDEHILALVDSSSTDPARSLEIDSDKTLGEYAAEQGKKILYTGAYIEDNESYRVGNGSMHFECVSETQIIILVQAEVDATEPLTQGICTVRMSEGTPYEQQLEFTLTETPENTSIYVPVNPEAVSGVVFGNAVVTESPVSISVTLSGTIIDESKFSDMVMMCEGITGMEGGNYRDDNGGWTTELVNGQGTLSDILIVRVCDCATEEVIGEIVFERQ